MTTGSGTGHGPGNRPASGSPKAQRAVAILLTTLLFALVVVGFGAVGRTVDQAVWGYVVGAVCCVVMAVAGLRTQR